MRWLNKTSLSHLLLSCLAWMLIPHTLGLELQGPMCSALTSLAYSFTLDAATLDQSAVNPGGSSHGFNAFLHKWIHHPAGGRPLNVVVQGGSFSSGLGIQPGAFYALRFVQALESINPAVKITLTNSAVGAEQQAVLSLSLLPTLPYIKW